MRSIGFVVSSKENGRRRALLPPVIAQLRHADHLIRDGIVVDERITRFQGR